MEKVEYVLTNIPLVLERIFSFLSARDLLRLQSVCKSWKSCSADVLRGRKSVNQVEYITYVKNCDEDKQTVKFKRSNRQMTWKKNSSMYKEFSEWRNEWHCAPTAGISVSMSNDRIINSFNYDHENMIRYWLPPANKLLTLRSVYSVVCVDSEKASIENIVDDISDVFNYISFPQSLSNLFSVNYFNLEEEHSSEDHDKFIQTVGDELEHCDTKLVFVSVVSKDSSLSPLHKNILKPAACRGVVVIGCIFETLIIFNPDNGPANSTNGIQDYVIVSFKGKNVRSASVLVGSHVDTIKELNACLETLQETVKSFGANCPNMCKFKNKFGHCASCNSQTLGFMVACCSRANPQEWYVEEDTDDFADVPRNLEQEAFRKMIPNVPLLGIYGMGEIGGFINLIGHQEKLFDQNSDLIKRESTVFAVVMLK
uniref:uncharacterized protein LOC120340897 n=1 Tax=Styela clava TaxID=7725 RepID=UPI00193AC5D8|nr:uncharacterized protein LOC120340897 [Styela clava]